MTYSKSNLREIPNRRRKKMGGHTRHSTIFLSYPLFVCIYPAILPKSSDMHTDLNRRRKNITRFTYEFTSFQGWRVTLCRQQEHFTRYFSDKQYGGAEASLRAAEEMLERVKQFLNASPNNPALAFAKCRQLSHGGEYPPGLRPRKDDRKANAPSA